MPTDPTTPAEASAAAALLNRAHFTLAASNLRHLPPDEGAEVAFAGRSNSGKSSAINAITRHKALARTSRTPGRTRQLLFFELDPGSRLVDLPGYGFAKVSRGERRHWDQLLDGYLRSRRSLTGLVLIMDIRHPLRDTDGQLLEWCAQAGLPVRVLLSKADKLGRGAIARTLQQVRGALRGGGLVEPCVFSAHSGLGLEATREWIGERLSLVADVPPTADYRDQTPQTGD